MHKQNKWISILFAVLVILSIVIPASIIATETTSSSINESYISAVSIKETITGLAPFDSDDNAGNDSSATNNIVRSFDNVNYTLEYVTALKTQDTISDAYLCVELILPYVKEIATFDMDTMTWIENPVLTEENGQQILTGKRHLQNTSTNNIIPGTGTLSVGIKIQGAPNKNIIQPTFSVWMEGNNDSESKTISSTEIIVSAAPKYNIQLKHANYYLNYLGYFNSTTGTGGRAESDGNLHGRMVGYGITIQLYNNSVDKGLKGIELPQGDLEFDLTLKEQTSTNSSSDVTFTDGYTPVLWDYKANVNSNTGKLGRNMIWGDGNTAFAYAAAPYQGLSSSGNNNNRIYQSGDWNINQTGTNTYHVSISNYKINSDYIFPIANYPNTENNIDYTSNIGCFSAGYIQILCSFPKEVGTTTNIYMTVEASNLNAKSVTGQTSNDVYSADNKETTNLTLYPKGYLSKGIMFQNSQGAYLESSNLSNQDGKGSLLKGSSFIAGIWQSQSNYENNIKSYNTLLKFDDKAFLPNTEKLLNKTIVSGGSEASSGEITTFYAAKPDGTGWANHSEMVSAKEEDLVFFSSYKELTDAGLIPVAVLIEARNCNMIRSNYVFINMKLKEDVEAGSTYCMVSDLRAWNYNVEFSYSDVEYDFSINSYPKDNASNTYVKGYPEPTGYVYTRAYIKSEFDENGILISGTHSGGYVNGNSILALDYKTEVIKKIATTSSDGSTKNVFDMDINERIIEYAITPKTVVNSFSSVGEATTLYVKDTLPSSLTYIEGTSYWGTTSCEPTITNNSDGSTTLLWTLQDVIIGKSLDNIKFKCTIGHAGTNNDVVNNQIITNSVVISSDTDRRPQNSTNKNYSEVSFSIIKLSAVSISKSTSTPFVSIGQDFDYTLKFANNSENAIANSKLYDVLPYNEDDRGSDFSGFYKINSIVLNFANAPKTFTDYTNGTYALNYTNDSNIQTSNFTTISTFTNWSEGSTKTVDPTNKTVTYTGLPEDIKALLFNMSLQGFEYIEITLNMSPTGNQQEGDAYINDFYQYANGQVEQVHSNQAIVQIYGTLNITKIWNDHNNMYETRPNSINISILQNGNIYRILTFNSSDAVFGNSNKWNEIVREVPLYDNEGNPYIYTIVEDENNSNIKHYYYEPHYNQDTLTVTNTGIWLQMKPDSLEPIIHKIIINKNIINTNGSIAVANNFEELNLNPSTTYSFPIILKQLNRTISKGETTMIESYNGYSGKTFNGIVTNKNSLTFFNIEAGKYEISEGTVQYFEFVNFEKLNATNGITFSQENSKYYITISSLTENNESIEIAVTNKINNERFYEDKNNKENLFLINKTGIDHNVPEE